MPAIRITGASFEQKLVVLLVKLRGRCTAGILGLLAVSRISSSFKSKLFKWVPLSVVGELNVFMSNH